MDKKGVPPDRGFSHPPDMQPITEGLRKMKFRKKYIGGVDEADVWKKLEGLQQTYESVLNAQAAYYQAQIDERDAKLKMYGEAESAVYEVQSESVMPGGGVTDG